MNDSGHHEVVKYLFQIDLRIFFTCNPAHLCLESQRKRLPASAH
jgi:hypothetical protein